MSQTTRGARTWPNQLDVARQIADGVRRAPSAAQVQVAGRGLFRQVTCAWPGRSMLCSLESDRGICRAYPVERGQRTEAGLLSSEKKTCVCMFSGVQLSVAQWTVAHQVPLSLGFSRQEYWSGWPLPPPGDLPDPGDLTHVPCIGRWILYH